MASQLGKTVPSDHNITLRKDPQKIRGKTRLTVSLQQHGPNRFVTHRSATQQSRERITVALEKTRGGCATSTVARSMTPKIKRGQPRMAGGQPAPQLMGACTIDRRSILSSEYIQSPAQK